MGNGKSKSLFRKKNANRNHKITSAIDAYLQELQEQHNRTISILLLGVGRSGKSTILSQVHKIYTDTPSTLENVRKYIQQDVLRNIYYLAKYNVILTLSNNSCKLHENADTTCANIASLSCHQFQNSELSADFASNMSILCNDPGFKQTLKICELKKLLFPMYNMPYFMKHVERILSTVGVNETNPHFDDVIRMRQRTTKIVENTFMIDCDGIGNSNEWKMMFTDVGGCRTQRKKWLRCFTDKNCILFVVSLLSYDEVVDYEDFVFVEHIPTLFSGYIGEIEELLSYNTIIPQEINNLCLRYYQRNNALMESFEVFDKVVKHERLRTVDVFVLFNKNDLFVEKIKTVPFTVFDENFDKGLMHDAAAVKQYLELRFKECFYNGIDPLKSPRRIRFHVTSAISTESIQKLMYFVQFDTVRSIMRTGMIL